MNPVNKIEKILKDSAKKENNTGDIFLNVIKNEFIMLNGRIEIPRIAVKELDYIKAIPILKDISDYIPEFLSGHELLVDRKPASEQHSLHFVKSVKGKIFDYIHIFKIFLKFEGDSRNIIEKGDTGNYPSYSTDRLYYKSRLIPVTSITNANGKIDFTPMRMVSADYIKSDQKLFTSAIFDELDRKEITRDIHDRLAIDVFNISTEIYPFIVFDYFTACFNVLYPVQDEIEKAIEIFEPVFITVFDKYNSIQKLDKYEEIKEVYKDQLYFVEEAFIKIKFLDELKPYFSRWSVERDDDLTLKGWWRIKSG